MWSSGISFQINLRWMKKEGEVMNEIRLTLRYNNKIWVMGIQGFIKFFLSFSAYPTFYITEKKQVKLHIFAIIGKY